MNNLPISTSAPQSAAKPASAVAPVEDSAATQGKPFGDVLARQVSEAASSDGTSLPVKKISDKAAEDALEKITTDEDSAAPVLGAEPPVNLPTDMLAALIPQAIANSVPGKSVDAQTASDISEQAVSELTADVAGLPKQTSAAGTASAALAADASGLPKLGKAATADAANTASGLDIGKTAPAKPGMGAAREALMDSKKDAVFTSMLATMNATMPNKLANSDDKAAALAAAPQPNAAALAFIQASAAPLTPAIALPATLTINTPVTHDKWGDEFNQKITWLASSKEQSAELHLNPPQLGPMDVVLKVSGDQATALFSSPHAAVREAIEQALPKLREMLADSGIMLGNASVNDQAPRNRQNDSDNRSSGTRAGIGAIGEMDASSKLSARVSPISRHNGIVDTFA